MTTALIALAGAYVPPAPAATMLPPLADPPTGKHIAGKFVWFDLASSEPAAAQRFYGAVFGWKFDAVRGSPEKYAVILNEGRPIGGIFRPTLPSGEAPRAAARWLPFASVPDIERALAKLTAGGAKVLVPATKVARRGTHALLRDSQGAIVGVLQSANGDPPDALVAPGDFFWVDLAARDPVAAARAYGEIGYEVYTDEVSGGERLLLAAGGRARAGIVRLQDMSRESGWLPYVQVEDVPATLALVRAAGGKVLREPDPSILGGQLAVFSDPQGGVLGIVHWAPDGAGASQK